MDEVKLAQLAKIIKPFSSAKGNNAVIKGMQKGLGFNIDSAKIDSFLKKRLYKKPSVQAPITKGSQAGVLKLGELDKAEKVFEKISAMLGKGE